MPGRRRRSGYARCRSKQRLLRGRFGHHRQLDQEARTAAPARLDGDRAAVLLDDAVGDRQPETRPGADLLRREERVEDALLELARDAGPGAAKRILIHSVLPVVRIRIRFPPYLP